jgi:hypothetical protein
MMEAAPATAFVMAEADLLLEFEIVAFDPPPELAISTMRSSELSAGSVESQ